MYSDSPVRFLGVSGVTTSRGKNDPQLGDEAQEGSTKYMFVYNDCNSSLAVGTGVILQSGASGYSVTLSSVTGDRIIGVVKNAAIPTAAYGWVVTKGFTTVQMMTASGTASAAQTPLQIAANGLFAPASNVTGNVGGQLGWSLGVIASATSGAAYISVY
jgi:hypothetical protein